MTDVTTAYDNRPKGCDGWYLGVLFDFEYIVNGVRRTVGPNTAQKGFWGLFPLLHEDIC